MNRLLIVLILLTGCVHKEAIQEPPKVQRVTDTDMSANNASQAKKSAYMRP